MSELVFNVQQEEDGGYSAAAVGEHISTQGDTSQQLRANVQEAVEAHFHAGAAGKPEKVRLHLTPPFIQNLERVALIRRE